MFKVKHERTADCVVAGYRTHKSSDEAIGSLLLGLYADDGKLASVGVVGAFPMAQAPGAVHRTAAAGHHVRRAPVELGQAGRRGGHPARGRGQPVERGQGPVVHPAAPRAGGRGPLRPHGRPQVPAHGPVRPLARPTGTRSRAPTRSSKSRSASTSATFSADPQPGLGLGIGGQGRAPPHVPAEQVALVRQHVRERERQGATAGHRRGRRCTIRPAPGPASSGLTVRHSSSSRPALASWASRCGPPSQEIRWCPRSASASTAAVRSTLASPATITSAVRAAAARRPGGADSVVMTMVRACAGALGQQRAVEVHVQPAGDDRDRWRWCPALPEPGPAQPLGLRPHRAVARHALSQRPQGSHR